MDYTFPRSLCKGTNCVQNGPYRMNIFFTPFEVFLAGGFELIMYKYMLYLHISERDSNDDVLFTILSKMKKNSEFREVLYLS